MIVLEIRPNCECCDRDLLPSSEAWICSYECTFCPVCALRMNRACPNCGGNLVMRPLRPIEKLTKDPASTTRVRAKMPCP